MNEVVFKLPFVKGQACVCCFHCRTDGLGRQRAGSRDVRHAGLCPVHMLSLAKQRAFLWCSPSPSAGRVRDGAALLLGKGRSWVLNPNLSLWQSWAGSFGCNMRGFLIHYSVLWIILNINENQVSFPVRAKQGKMRWPSYVHFTACWVQRDQHKGFSHLIQFSGRYNCCSLKDSFWNAQPGLLQERGSYLPNEWGAELRCSPRWTVIPGETSSRSVEQRVLMASSPCDISSFSSSNSGYDCQQLSWDPCISWLRQISTNESVMELLDGFVFCLLSMKGTSSPESLGWGCYSSSWIFSNWKGGVADKLCLFLDSDSPRSIPHSFSWMNSIHALLMLWRFLHSGIWQFMLFHLPVWDHTDQYLVFQGFSHSFSSPLVKTEGQQVRAEHWHNEHGLGRSKTWVWVSIEDNCNRGRINRSEKCSGWIAVQQTDLLGLEILWV